ncbi:MAG: class I SAM-dependent RNA methyltransferase [Treponema sp.]|jgi:23S rRNA (uracil1939-C5)-methyltransferase|nr:class I SAM-dependent RNA methyltransferase [Treponema sp.]
MAQGERHRARVESIAAGGAGLARIEGKSVFVDLAAPGDLAVLHISEERRSWARAEIAEILEPSPLRVEPVCPLFGRCGGCSLQHLNYDAQLSAKETILKEAFSRIGGLTAPEIRLHPSAPLEYRNRVQLHCFPADRRRLGFKQRKEPAIVPLRDCPAADPGIRRALGEGNLVPPPDKDRFTVYSRGGLFLSEGGKSRGRVSLGGKELLMDAAFFFQSNGTMLELLLEDLAAGAEKADPGLPMADLYCGVGTFAAFLGNRFSRTDLVEENKAALALARENLGDDCRFFALSDDEWVKSLKGKEAWSFMVADPPRGGLSVLTRRYLAEKGPPLLAYVSCDPATLARDAGELAVGGYTVKELNLYDFYPQTAHIESLAVFNREGASHGC